MVSVCYQYEGGAVSDIYIAGIFSSKAWAANENQIVFQLVVKYKTQTVKYWSNIKLKWNIQNRYIYNIDTFLDMRYVQLKLICSI